MKCVVTFSRLCNKREVRDGYSCRKILKLYTYTVCIVTLSRNTGRYLFIAIICRISVVNALINNFKSYFFSKYNRSNLTIDNCDYSKRLIVYDGCQSIHIGIQTLEANSYQKMFMNDVRITLHLIIQNAQQIEDRNNLEETSF